MIYIPERVETCEVKYGAKKITLTNLTKVFWPASGKTKRDLLTYYIAVSAVLLPHLKDRAMVLKRYPAGIEGEVLVMKRTPLYRPAWLQTCRIAQKSGSVTELPIVQDLASLLWIVNLGCIDLNPWYAPCDDPERPDFLHFDLDPVCPATFDQVRETALIVKGYLDKKKVESYAKTTGSRGMHIYVPIHRKEVQREVWRVAKHIAVELAKQHPDLITSEYRAAHRPEGKVLLDYNQNAWGRTLASVYSVRPRQQACVSTPVTWDEVERGISTFDFIMERVIARVEKMGDLFKPVLRQRSRCPLEALV